MSISLTYIKQQQVKLLDSLSIATIRGGQTTETITSSNIIIESDIEAM